MSDNERSALREVRTVLAGNAVGADTSPAVTALDKILTIT